MCYYAQINNEGFIEALSQLLDIVETPNMISITEEQFGWLNTEWQYVNGKWVRHDFKQNTIHLELLGSEVIQAIEDLRIDLIVAGVIQYV